MVYSLLWVILGSIGETPLKENPSEPDLWLSQKVRGSISPRAPLLIIPTLEHLWIFDGTVVLICRPRVRGQKALQTKFRRGS